MASRANHYGLVLSPVVFSDFLPWIIVGALSLLSVVLCVLLPETFRQPLPDTIQEMAHIKRSVLAVTCASVCDVCGYAVCPLAGLVCFYYRTP